MGSSDICLLSTLKQGHQWWYPLFAPLFRLSSQYQKHCYVEDKTKEGGCSNYCDIECPKVIHLEMDIRCSGSSYSHDHAGKPY